MGSDYSHNNVVNTDKHTVIDYRSNCSFSRAIEKLINQIFDLIDYEFTRTFCLCLSTEPCRRHVKEKILNYTGWPQKVSHYRESSLNRIKNRQPGYIFHKF